MAHVGKHLDRCGCMVSPQQQFQLVRLWFTIISLTSLWGRPLQLLIVANLIVPQCNLLYY
jgi:hypothetical protein